MSACGKESHHCSSCPSFKTGIFSCLEESNLAFLEQYKAARQYARKEYIFSEGDPVTALYCIRSGSIKVYKTNPEGKQQILKIAQPGTVLGHTSFFSGNPHTETAEALEETDVCILDKRGFLSILQSNSSVAMKLITQLSRELIRSEEQVLDLAYKSVRMRFVQLLLALKQNFGVYDEGMYRLNIALSREELAQAIGTTEETCVRLLSEFRADGLIQAEKKMIILLHPEKLQAFTAGGY